MTQSTASSNVTGQLAEVLEHWLDRTSVAEVLEALATICNEKAEHVNHAWQDATLARAWTSAARRIDTAIRLLPAQPGIGRR